MVSKLTAQRVRSLEQKLVCELTAQRVRSLEQKLVCELTAARVRVIGAKVGMQVDSTTCQGHWSKSWYAS